MMSDEAALSSFERFAKSIQPKLFAMRYPNLKVDLDMATRARLQELRNYPVVICPNHSRHEDGELVFLLSIMTKQPVKFLAAKEMFRSYLGLGGVVLRLLGCYEVNRGADNADAILTVQKRLARESSKLVIFPEGEISYNNDRLEALEPGAAAIGLDAMQVLRKDGRVDQVYLMPLAISYQFDDPLGVCVDLIAGLEKKLGIQSAADDLFGRARRICYVYLNSLQTGVSVMPELISNDERVSVSTSIDERVSAMFDSTAIDEKVSAILHDGLQKIANKIDCRLHEESVLHQIHHVQSKIFALKRKSAPWQKSKYENLYQETLKLVRLRSLSGKTFAANSSLHSLADALNNLNHLIKGRQCASAQTAIVSAGDVIPLANYAEAFEDNKTKAIDAATASLAEKLQERLDELRSTVKVDFVGQKP